MKSTINWARVTKRVLIGRARELTEEGLFHKLSLVAMFAWVGLGADGLSSSCYGPEEIYKALLAHPPLVLIVALMAAVTIFVICASYSQIIELFPSGGGGYVVASRLLSPAAGVVSGSALLIDYVLTISISVASAMDALFSFLPTEWAGWKLTAALSGVVFLTLLNLRGVRESVMLWVPIFFLFLLTHAFAIGYAIVSAGSGVAAMPADTWAAVHSASSDIGLAGLAVVLLRAYSMGAGTFTGIEAVSNGLPILREPRVRTGRRTMALMAFSLASTVVGLLVAYVLMRVQPVDGKTLNAVLFEAITAGCPDNVARTFVAITLGSAAALLFIAAQAGFLDGPRVLANMALDRWMPARFAALSDRFVTSNGVMMMGGAALAVLLLTHGSVALLLVLYSINVFITFSLSQLGMVRHGWHVRGQAPRWKRRLAVNLVGLALTTFILATLVVVKFHEGGWVTVAVTALVVVVAFAIRRHYRATQAQLVRLNEIVEAAAAPASAKDRSFALATGSTSERTAVVLVNGFNGLGLHTLLGAARLFGGAFRRFVFVQVGVLDAGNFKGADEVERLRAHVEKEANRYVEFVRVRGGEAEAVIAIGHEVVDEVEKSLALLMRRFPDVVVFGGQLVFARETLLTRWLHNYTVFAVQRRLFLQGLPFAIIPAQVDESAGRALGESRKPCLPFDSPVR